jgi:hypothetical protein
VAWHSRQHLDALLYEQVTDPATRRGLRASRGFCNWHTWMLLEIHGGRSSAAIIYEDLLGGLIEQLRGEVGASSRRRSWLSPRRGARTGRARPRETCPICADAARAERRYLEAMLAAGDDVKAAYARSDGLCGPHVLRAMAAAPRGPGSDWLAARTAAKWAGLREALGRFIQKHDHRNRAPFTAAEAAACERAFEVVSGASGLFGNDLHRHLEGA